MAFPFGGHPTFGEYMRWARDTHQIHAKTGYASDPDGQTIAVVKLVKPDGDVVVVATEQGERLLPTQVGNLDRRLRVKSPWFSTPE